MAVQPERRCVPVEMEMISLHREPRPARWRRPFRSWVTALVRSATRRSRA